MAALALRLCSARRPQRKRPVETVVGNGRFRGAGGGTGMTGDGWEAERRLTRAILKRNDLLRLRGKLRKSEYALRQMNGWVVSFQPLYKNNANVIHAVIGQNMRP